MILPDMTKREADVVTTSPITITKDELKLLEAETISTPITLLDETTPEDQLSRVMSRLSQVEVLGLDTETKPSFTKGEHHRVALLQLASVNEVVLIRLCTLTLESNAMQYVANLLADPKILKVGVGIHGDAAALLRDHRLQCSSVLELELLARAANILEMSLTKIYAACFGKRISKAQRLTNWEATSLTPAQEHYAALDALAGLRIYMRLKTHATESMIVESPHKISRSTKVHRKRLKKANTLPTAGGEVKKARKKKSSRVATKRKKQTESPTSPKVSSATSAN